MLNLEKAGLDMKQICAVASAAEVLGNRFLELGAHLGHPVVEFFELHKAIVDVLGPVASDEVLLQRFQRLGHFFNVILDDVAHFCKYY